MVETKQKLARTLKQLMRTTPVDQITINQLTKHAQVARNTFYYHFTDINQLLAWIYQQEIVQQLTAYRQEKNGESGLMILLAYIENNRHFCMNTFSSLSRDLLSHFLYRVAFDMVTGVIIDLAPNCRADLRDEIANFYGWALATQMEQWLVTNLAESKQEFVQRMYRMLHGTIAHVIQQNPDFLGK